MGANRRPPIPFRPPEGDEARLDALIKSSGEKRNRILVSALREYLDRREGQHAEGARPA